MASAMKIVTPILRPFISKEAIELANETLNSGWIGAGEVVKKFENKISELIDNSFFLAVNSGSSALNLAYDMCQIEEDDEVITTPFTCLATNIPILHRKAIPIWADIKMDGTIDPNQVRSKITKKTKAIVIVHFGGNPCDIAEINSISKQFNIPVIEDAAHAFGARYEDKPIGSHSDFVCFSFQSVKNLTTVDGGGISFKNQNHYKICKNKRWFGINRDNRIIGDSNVEDLGYKMEMNDVLASIGLGNLLHFNNIIEHNERLANIYIKKLSNIRGIKIVFKNNILKKPSFWLFPILAKNKNDLQNKLLEKGIETSPIHYRNDKVKIFKNYDTSFLPNTDKFSNELICLPIGFWVSNEEVESICEIIKNGW